MLLLGIPVVVLPIMLIGRRLRALSRTSQDRVADVGATVAEVLGAMKIVQAFGQEQREAGRFQAAVAATFAVARRRILMGALMRSEEHTSELQYLMRLPYAVFCSKKKTHIHAIQCHKYNSVI